METKQQAFIFYDGHCGMCHRFIKFVLKNDKKGSFAFSPRQGDAIQRMLTPNVVSKLPESIVVLGTDNKIYLKSFALSYVLRSLGGIYAFANAVMSVFPLRFRNVMYDLISKNRKRFAQAVDSTCPIVPAEFRERFLN